MILRCHSDASYLSVPKGRSRAGGYFYLSSAPISLVTDTKPTTEPKPTALTEPVPPLNNTVYVLCTIIRNVMVSTTEAEITAVFCSCQEVLPLRQALIFMGHPQPPIPVQVDNEYAVRILMESVKQRKSKAMDMRFYWVRDRIKQGYAYIYWRRVLWYLFG